MGQSGRGDIRENVADLEHQFRLMKGDYALSLSNIKGEIHALVNPELFIDIWAHVRKIEKRFHLMQGNYQLRISSMQVATTRCKRHMQTSRVLRYSSVSAGGSLSDPRYQDDRASGHDPTLTANMYGSFGAVQHCTYGGNAFTHGTVEDLYALSEPLIPLAPLVPLAAEHLCFPDEPIMPIEPSTVQHVSDTAQSYAPQHAHDKRKSLKRSFDRI